MRIWEGLVEVFSPFCRLDDAGGKEDKISGLCVGKFHKGFYICNTCYRLWKVFRLAVF